MTTILMGKERSELTLRNRSPRRADNDSVIEDISNGTHKSFLEKVS
jgi:hypothetical protein